MIAFLGLEERFGTSPGLARSRYHSRATYHIDTQVQRLPWVAQIVGARENGWLERMFLGFMRDYRDASRSGKRGIRRWYVLYEGYYDVYEILSMSRDRRYWLKQSGGILTEVTRDDVYDWLRNEGFLPASRS